MARERPPVQLLMHASVRTGALTEATRSLCRDADSRDAVEMIEVGWFESRSDAEFARSLLAEAGIPVVLAPDDLGVSSRGRAGGARLFVAEKDVDLAEMILGDRAPEDGGR